MKRKISTSIVLAVLICSINSFAQQKKRCGTSEYMAKMKAEDPTLSARMHQDEMMLQQIAEIAKNQRTINGVATITTIPVIFHVLWKTSAQNITQNRINDQLNTLNKDYGRLNADSNNTPAVWRPIAVNTNIQFCLAQRDPSGNALTEPGIKRVNVSATGFDPISNQNAKYTANGGDDAWPRGQYLNVWVVNFTGSSGGLLGISQFPNGTAATDGCCVLYTTIGGSTYHGTEVGYNLGRTLTHEVGHWFGLYHVWGDDDNQNGTCEPATECSGTDNIADTPNQGEENYGNSTNVTFPHIDCCSTTATGDPVNGVMFMNYMDYVDDNWMNMFTAGQAARMTNVLASIATRHTLTTSNGCLAPIGIAELNALMLDVTVFPNPSSGNITISGQLVKYSDVTVTISNAIGEVVYSKELKNALDIYLPVDLSAKAKGVYNLTIRSNDAVINKKVVVSR